MDDASRGGLQTDETCVSVSVNLVCDLSIRRGRGSNKPNHSMQRQADRTLVWNTRDEREQLHNREHLTLVSSLPHTLYTHTLRILTRTHITHTTSSYRSHPQDTQKHMSLFYLHPTLGHITDPFPVLSTFLLLYPFTFPQIISSTSYITNSCPRPSFLPSFSAVPTTSPGITLPSHLHPHPTPP